MSSWYFLTSVTISYWPINTSLSKFLKFQITVFFSWFKPSCIPNSLIGTGNSLLLKSKNMCILDADNIYLGEQATEPLVLGYKLVEILNKMIQAIGQLQVSATIGGVSAPVIAGGSKGWTDLMTLGRDLNSCLSSFHYIENNEVSK